MCCAVFRGELGPDEDATSFTPQVLLKRKPSLAFVTLIAILDPPRDEAIEAVKVAHDAGITVKMITGELRRQNLLSQVHAVLSCS